MADTKISALAAVTTPALTDEFGVNQAGTSKKLTLSQVRSLSAPTFVAVGTSATGIAAVVPGLPAGHTTNDILLLFVQSSNETVTAPAEWTKLGPAVGFGTAVTAGSTRLTIFWKRHDGSEVDPTVADTGDHTLAQIMAIRGCATTGDPFVSVGQLRKRTASTTGTAHAGATHVDNCMVVNAFAHANDAATAVFSVPTNASLTSVTEQIDVATADGTGGGIGVVTGILASAGSFVGTTVTEVSAVDVSSTFYLIPTGTTIAAATDRQEFITPTFGDTWTKPSAAKYVEMVAIGGGASGSAGRNAATAAGGGGGGGGAWQRVTVGAAELPATMTVTVGAGGAATANTDGAASTAGASSTATASGMSQVSGGGFAATASATGAGGAGGGGGTVLGIGAAVAGAQTNVYGSQPAPGGTGATTAAAGSNQGDFGGGGGAGGGTTQAATAGGVARNGGGGGGGGRSNTNFGTGGQGGGSNAGGATVGAAGTESLFPEVGGGGGAAGNSATGPGGAGGWPGGGGGGGGSQSGAQRGGAGGDGVVVITTIC